MSSMGGSLGCAHTVITRNGSRTWILAPFSKTTKLPSSVGTYGHPCRSAKARENARNDHHDARDEILHPVSGLGPHV